MMSRFIWLVGGLSMVLVVACNSSDTQGQTRIALMTEEPLPLTDTVFVTGSSSELGGWNGRGLAMQRDATDPNTWALQFAPKDSAFAYKFTLGTWDFEAKLQEGLAFRDLGGWQDMDTTVHAVSFGPAKRVNIGQVSGHLTLTMSPADPKGIIPSRRMWVWTPVDLARVKLDGPMDLLLMSDGQNCIDPSTSTFGVDWAVDEAILTLMKQGKIPPTIVVALDCATESGNRRRLEYGPGTLGEAYTDYLVHTVLPYIEAEGNISEKSRVFFAGSSMGGVLAFRLLTEYPRVFDGALSFSPAVFVETCNGLVVDAITPWKERGAPFPDGHFYMDNGGIGLDAQLQPGIDRLKNTLSDLGYPGTEHAFKWVLDSKADHSEVAWKKRFPSAFEWLSSQP